ncbi:hypothetical protein NXF25_012955 [Crotalus adamanteus]|uniref:Uncharacterized protein n=1 Tax=Crotalus adamanteus TaxID=8729 RepID=A0AAW1BDU7_CROAD
MDKERRAGGLNKANEITCSAFLFASLIPLLDNKASIDTQLERNREGRGKGVSVSPQWPPVTSPRSLMRCSHQHNEAEKQNDLMISKLIHAKTQEMKRK